MKIVVIGGTGLVGSKLVTRLAERHDVLAASPATGVDTLTGEGLAEAMDGAAAVVDVSNPPAGFLETSTRNLLAAEGTLGVEHHVALSVVGAGCRAKLVQEKLIEDAAIPHSIVRATLFFESLLGIAAAATDGDVVRLPPALVQPIAAADVAATLGRVAIGPALNRVVEVAGPERVRLDELVRRSLDTRGDPRRVVTGRGGRCLLPGDDALLGRTRYEDWAA